MPSHPPPSAPSAERNLPGIARALMAAKLLSADQALRIDATRKAMGGSFIGQLIDQQLVSAGILAHMLSKGFALPLLDLSAIAPQHLPQNALDPKLVRQHRVLPLAKRDGRMIVATADPTQALAAQAIAFATGVAVDWVVVEYDKLLPILSAFSSGAGSASEDIFTDDASAGVLVVDEVVDVEDAPVVKFLQGVLNDASSQGASDLHFEPYEFNYRVRFRIDGELREVAAPPSSIKEKLAARIKVLSRLDISERRVPQDGRMKLRMDSGTVLDFRVSTLPTLFGEKIVIRILDSNAAKVGIDSLGYDPQDKALLIDAVSRPYGMVLVTGPTGSGKTVSLYSCLNILNKPGVNISTAEDPAEINMPGINQVNVNDRAGLTFAGALRAFLRQDPDIIMVGEIRDIETGDIAIKAAQTGHMVLSTLHTNDAPATLTRLMNMGIAPFNIASSVILITAQRLVKRLCQACKTPVTLDSQTLRVAGANAEHIQGYAAGAWSAYKPVGCAACNNGYKGRVGVYQVMPITESMQRIILNNGTALEIAKQAQADGVRTLRQAGLAKVMQGVTTLEEIMGATNE